VGGIPFDARSYNAEIVAAMREPDRISRDPSVMPYSSFAEMLTDIETNSDE
jgi:hypothetical protein